MKHLSSLQRKLALGLDMLRHVVSQVSPYFPPKETKRPSGDWDASRRRLSEIRGMIDEINRLEATSAEGSAELYWRAKANAVERDLILVQLQLQETEYLGRAIGHLAKFFESAAPPERLENLSSCLTDEAVLVQHWARAADENLRLLEELSKVEVSIRKLKDSSVLENVAVENAQSLIGLSQLEESLYSGHHPELAALSGAFSPAVPDVLSQLAQLRRLVATLESRIVKIHEDGRAVESYLARIMLTETIPDSRERRDLVERCIEIGRNYLESGERQALVQ